MFETVFGPLTLHERIDHAEARRSYRTSGGEASFERFLPRWSHPEQADDQIAAVLTGLERRYAKDTG